MRRTPLCLLVARGQSPAVHPVSKAACAWARLRARCATTNFMGNNRMTISTSGRILWPRLPAEFHQLSREAVGAGFQTEFCAEAEDVTDAQWAEADAVVGSCP